jgi:tetratricopeptide (TPR) repeat protein
MPFSEPYPEVVDIQPFWQRLPYFFLYPLHFEPLLYLLLLSCVTLLGSVLPFLLLLVVILGVILAFVRYAYKILDRTALGLLNPDQDLPVFDDESRTSLPYKQFGILLVIGFVIELANRAGGLLFGAALIYGTLSMPAATMTLAVTRSFWSAINPFAVVGMMSTIGMPYLGLSAFIFLLSASSSVLQRFLAPRVPAWMLLPTLTFIVMYFALIMFNMMGYVLYQYHQALGLRVRQTGPSGKNSRAGGAAAGSGGQADSYAELIASGQIDKALDQAYEEKRIDPENVTANDRYHKLLLLSHSSSGQRILARLQEAEQRGDPASVRQYLEAELSRHRERLLSHTRSYLALLLKKNLAAEAVGVYRAMREQIADFEPEEPALLNLAKAARQVRDPQLALSLVKGFDKRFPRSDEIPDVYFFAAQTLSEDYREDAKACQILSHLLKRYPQHPIGDKARRLLNFIERTRRA